MSRTTDSEILSNPCKKFLSWRTVREIIKVDGDDVEKMKGGTFSYFDKDRGEKGEKVDIKLPLRFALINADLVSFKGYDEKNKQGVWSNEVSDPNHVVNFRNKEGKLLSFKLSEYKLNKDALAGYGGKYTKSVYIAVDVNGTWELWNLQLSGGALSGSPDDFSKMTAEEKTQGWFNFSNVNKANLYTNFIEVPSFQVKKKGQVKFTIPTYTLGETIDAADGDVFNQMDEQLKEYLAYYFKKPEVAKEEETKEEPVNDVTDY